MQQVYTTMVNLMQIWNRYIKNSPYHFREINSVETLKCWITWESVTLNTRFQGNKKPDASPKTRFETYTNFWNACTGNTKNGQVPHLCKFRGIRTDAIFKRLNNIIPDVVPYQLPDPLFQVFAWKFAYQSGKNWGLKPLTNNLHVLNQR